MIEMTLSDLRVLVSASDDTMSVGVAAGLATVPYGGEKVMLLLAAGREDVRPTPCGSARRIVCPATVQE